MLKLDTYAVHSFINANENLMRFYNWWLDNSLSISHPYHNLRHTLGMMYHVIRIYRDSKNRQMPEYPDGMNEFDLYILLTSTMFHDFNHSAGRFSDAINIMHAKDGLRTCLETFLPEGHERTEIYRLCSKNIDATQYPYVIDDSELDVQQRIMRECDILVYLYDDFFTQCMMGLMQEMRKTDKSEFLVADLKFILECVKKFKLSYSMKTWTDNQDSFLTEVNVISNIFQLRKP